METVRLVPIMLLHSPEGTGAVGRSELSHRAEEFASGHWRAPVESFLRNSPEQSRGRPERSDAEEGTPRESGSSKGTERAGVQVAT